MTRLSRRAVLLSGLPLVALGAPSPFAALERAHGGRLGLFASQGTRTVGWRAAERFAYCSVFKWFLAAKVLEQAQRGALSLDDRIRWTAADWLEPSTGTRPHFDAGMTVMELCHAAVTSSDNTATRLLERRVGGPAALQAFARSLGDTVTRFDREEPELNSNLPGDRRDTTTPQAMARLLEAVWARPTLNDASKAQLFAWMQATTTGFQRIRASVPEGWVAGDKTGTSDTGAVNDVAVLRPPEGPPVFLTVFVDARPFDMDRGALLIREATALALAQLR